MYPRYPYPPTLLFPLVRDWLLGRQRNFRRDARTFAALLGEGLRVAGLEHLDSGRPAVVVMNHYSRPGFGMWWLVVAIAAQLPRDPHLIMTDELTRWMGPLGNRFSRWALPRISHTYGFTSMPPMPPRPQDVQARAGSVRRVLSYLEATPNPLLLLAPEGRDNLDGGSLARPPAGVGRFLLLLADHGLDILPVAGWEADGALQVRFGPGFMLSLPGRLRPRERDHLATNIVMRRIAALLPEHLQGEYASPPK